LCVTTVDISESSDARIRLKGLSFFDVISAVFEGESSDRFFPPPFFWGLLLMMKESCRQEGENCLIVVDTENRWEADVLRQMWIAKATAREESLDPILVRQRARSGCCQTCDTIPAIQEHYASGDSLLCRLWVASHSESNQEVVESQAPSLVDCLYPCYIAGIFVELNPR